MITFIQTYPDYNDINKITRTSEAKNVILNLVIELLLLLGCPQGYYGENCSIPCPVNWLDGLCHTENGTCYGRLYGSSGPTCNEGYSQ